MPPAKRPVAPPPRRNQRGTGPSRPVGYLVGLGLGWFFVLMLWAGRAVRSTGSVVFLLAAVAAVVFLGGTIASMAKGRDAWRLARAGWVLLLFVAVPAVFDPKTYDVFNLTKYTITITGALVLAALWVVEWVRRGRLPLWRNGLQWPVLALVVWTAVTTGFSSNVRISLLGFYKSYDGLYGMIAFAIIVFAVVEAFTITDVKRALSVLYFGGGGLAVLYGLLQLHDRVLGGSKWDWVEWGDASFKGSSIWSTLGNPNHLAGFLCIVVPIGVGLFLVYERWWVRALIVAIAAGAYLEMIQTTTRGAFLGLLASLVVLALLFRPEIVRRPWVPAAFTVGFLVVGLVFTELLGRGRTRGSFGALVNLFTWKGIIGAAVASALFTLVLVAGERMGRPWMPLGAIAGAVVVLVLVGALAFQGPFGRVLTKAFDLRGNNTSVQRLELWKSALHMGGDRPLLGFGPDTFRIPFGRFQTPKFVDLYGPDQIANGPHNTFMNFLASEGFPGLLLFLGLIFFGGLRAAGAWRRLRRLELEGKAVQQRPAQHVRYLLVGSAGGMVAYLVQGTANVQQVALAFCFWGLLALIGAIALDVGVPNTLKPALLVAPGQAAEAEPERPPRSLGAAAKRSTGRPVRKGPPAKGRRPGSPGGPAPAKATAPLPVAEARRPAGGPRGRRPGASSTTVGVTAAAALVVAVALWWPVSGPWRADRSYRWALIHQSQAQSVGQSDPAQAQQAVTKARQDYGAAVAANSGEASYIEGGARLSFAIGQGILQPQQGRAPDVNTALTYLRDARDKYERGRKVQPHNPYLLEGYASVLLKLQEVDKADTTSRPAAVAALREAVIANPWQPRFARTLATILANQADVAAALQVLEKALTYTPRDGELLRQTAKLYEQAGQKDKADPLWERLLAAAPTDPEANAALGRTPVTPTAPVTPNAPAK